MSRPATIKNRGIRILLSGGFIAGSAAYAFWQHTAQSLGAPPAMPVHEAAAPPALPQQQAAISRIDASPQQPTAPTEKRSDTAPKNAAPITEQAPAPASQPVLMAEPAPPVSAPPVAATPEPVSPPLAPSIPMASNAPPEPPSAPTKHAAYVDGDFTGKPAYTSWGDVQVKVVVRNGAVAEVDPLDYPNHRRRSIQINDWAIPQLEQEAVTAQTANIDLVSQATVTSYGYQESLASALAQAKKQ